MIKGNSFKSCPQFLPSKGHEQQILNYLLLKAFMLCTDFSGNESLCSDLKFAACVPRGKSMHLDSPLQMKVVGYL